MKVVEDIEEMIKLLSTNIRTSNFVRIPEQKNEPSRMIDDRAIVIIKIEQYCLLVDLSKKQFSQRS